MSRRRAVNAPPELARLAATMRAPRAAAVAGIVFSVVFGLALALLQSAVPVDPADVGDWIFSDSQRTRAELALSLLPFAGIAFLWFIGVVRDQLGDREDRFFATVFLGSGLLFVALMFVGGAAMSALIGLGEDGELDPDVWRFGRRFVFAAMNVYALRTAAVFTITASTLSGRLGAMPRWLQIAGYLTAVALLFGPTFAPWVVMVFPIWVLAVSIQILRAGGDARPEHDGQSGNT